MSKLAAFAYREGDEVKVVEYLEDHLADVAIRTYLQIVRNNHCIAYLGLLAGLLHDVGKALEIYQRCTRYHKEDSKASCSYLAHEVFSAIIANEILDHIHVPRNIIEDVAAMLKCGIEEVWSYTKKIIVQAVLSHHQAMGLPIDRLYNFKESIGRVPRNLFRIRVELADTLRDAVSKVSKILGIEVEVELDVDAVRKLDEEVMNIIGRPSEASQKLQQLASLAGHRHLAIARFLTGCVILADIHTACTVRGERGRRSLCIYLNKFFSTLCSPHSSSKR